MPELRAIHRQNDLHFGLRALDAVRDRLKELDAHRGQPTSFRGWVKSHFAHLALPHSMRLIECQRSNLKEGGWQ